ncbi:MAG: beta-N-acetylhexosaminidase [Bacilli bacterium]|nr:beta-N-acetylhexosaminidase [Bacilli bacterium]
MKRNRILICLLLLLFLVGCSSSKEKKNMDNLTGIDKKVEEQLNKMTLDEKIGQMMIVFYHSTSMDNTLKKSLEEVQPGGFILFADNITNYENTLKFIKDVKSTAKIPMFMSIDEEGGNVQRLYYLKEDDITYIPYMQEVGNKNDLELTKNVGKVLAEELRVFGINMDFAPVIDVYSNPNNTVIGKRAFGSDKELVAKHGMALANGLEENGVIPVYKHFPGHGNTAVDSHFALPVVDKTKEELLDLDLYPFKEVIKNGAKIIMIGHLAVPSITGDNTPASLSKKLITNFLKEELGYNGLVITDALNMGALTNYYSSDEICAKAVEAGVDILLMPTASRKCLASVKSAIAKGDIDEERIDESVRKILKLKYEYLEKGYEEYLPKEYLNSKEHQEIISEVSK